MSLYKKNIRHYKFRYILTFLIVLLMNVVIFASAILIDCVENGINRAKNRIGADLVVSSKVDNFDTLAESIMYNGVPNTLFVDKKYIDSIKEMPHVTNVTSRLYLATLDGMSCCDDSIQLVATDLSTDFLLSSWVKSSSIEDNEIILGYKFNVNVGDTVKYFGRDFTVKEKLEKTGTGYDLSGFISYGAAYSIMNDIQYSDLFDGITDNTTSVIFINSDDINTTKNIIESTYYHELSVYSLNNKYAEFMKDINTIKQVVRIICIFLVVISYLSLFAIAAIAIDSRRNEVGSLLLIGKTKTFIGELFIREQLTVCLGAEGLAVVLLLILKGLFTSMMETILEVAFISNIQTVMIYIILLTLLNIVMSIGSVIFSVIHICKSSPAELIKESS